MWWLTALEGVNTLGSLFNKPDASQQQAQLNAQLLQQAQADEAARKMKNNIAIAVVSLLTIATIIGLVIYSRKHKTQ